MWEVGWGMSDIGCGMLDVGCWNCGVWIAVSEIIDICFKQINFRRSLTLPIHKKGIEFQTWLYKLLNASCANVKSLS